MARSYDLTSGSISQHLLRLAAPLIMGNILQQLRRRRGAKLSIRMPAGCRNILSSSKLKRRACAVKGKLKGKFDFCVLTLYVIF